MNKQKFWIDTNVLVQAKNDYYAFDIAPGFWDFIATNAKLGILRSPIGVYTEIAKGGDELTAWANTIKTINLFVSPDQLTQSHFKDIANYVNKSYEQLFSKPFLAGADPWVIAAAKATGGVVVTQERLVGIDSKKVKIPNICNQVGVSWMNSYEMLRSLGCRLICR